MIFRSKPKRWNGIYYLEVYHPTKYKRLNGSLVPNRNFNDHSRAILNLKYQNSNSLMDTAVVKKLQSVKQFCQRLDEILGTGFAIAIVPPHQHCSIPSGICMIAQLLAKENGRIDATGWLVRRDAINPLHNGGERTAALHFKTIDVELEERIKNSEVLLLDDIATTGNSINVCKSKLLKRGARVVECLVLGRTIKRALFW